MGALRFGFHRSHRSLYSLLLHHYTGCNRALCGLTVHGYPNDDGKTMLVLVRHQSMAGDTVLNLGTFICTMAVDPDLVKALERYAPKIAEIHNYPMIRLGRQHPVEATST